MNKYKLSSILITGFMFTSLVVVGCGNTASSNSTSSSNATTSLSTKRTIIDASGAKVEVPTTIHTIADSWQAHNEVVTILGSGNKIVATVLTPQLTPWLYKVNPQLSKAQTVFNSDGSANTEELVKTKPDIVFMPLNGKNANQVSQLGIPTVQLNFTDFKGLKETFELTGDILGNDAKKRADEYVSYLNSKLNMITNVTSKIPQNEKLKVLHITSLSPLTVDGSHTIIDSWIKVAGGVNAAADVKGNNKEVSMEQVLQWNPNVIILSSNTLMKINNGKGIMDKLLRDPVWKNVDAVKSGKVYFNPDGAFYWDRYSAEEALQIQWAAKTLYPDKFANIDIRKETMYFYKTFLNYNLTENEADEIMNDDPPIK